jgi:peptidoglycan-associated lipoprotein
VVAAVPEPEMVSVPNVVGMAKDQAEGVITGARLGLGTITLQQHKTVPAGHVISQDPSAGTRVPPGTPVHLVVSTGWPAEPAVSLQDVYFDYDRFVIRDDGKSVLEANAASLKADGNRKILIEGHCDERGTSDYNLVLGERRARAAKQYLQDLGVDGSRIQITSLGKEKPFCTEHNPTCWQSNRRVHFVVQ